MAIADDINVNYVNKIIGRDAAPSADLYTVNQLYSFLMLTFDDLAQMDDQVPMSAQTPTSYTMINGWYIREDLTRQLKTGAIQTSGYLDEVRALICGATGWTNFVPGDIGDTITSTETSDTGTLLDYDNVNYKLYIRMTGAGDLFDNATDAYTGAGTGLATSTAVSTTGETVFANPYSLGSIYSTPTLYVYQDGAVLDWSGFDADQSWSDATPIDILVKVTEGSVDIDSKTITVFAREFGELYSNFVITLTTAGQNAVPLGTSLDGNNESLVADVEDNQDGTTASIAVAYQFTTPFSYDIGDGNGVQDYDCEITCDGQSLGDVYEVTKYWTRRTSTKQLEVDSDSNFINGEAYLYADVGYSPVVSAPFGAFAGGKFFAARGVYFTGLHGDDAQAFQLIDNGGTTRNPPNYQAFVVNGVVSGDSVAVYEETAQGSGLVKKTQYSLTGSNNIINELTVTIGIPADTPSAGTITVVDDDGSEIAYAYSAWATSTFAVTIAADVYTGTETAYVPYIYEVAAGTSVSENTTIYVSNRFVVTKVRKASILPFVTSGSYTSTGYAGTAIRTTDSQYT